MAENKTSNDKRILEVFQSKIASLSADTAFKYRKTFNDFYGFISGHKLSLTDNPDAIVSDWSVEMLRQGLSLATVVQRLNIISSIFKTATEYGLMAPCAEPRDMAKALKSPDFELPPLLKASALDKYLALLRDFSKGIPQHNTFVDILLFSLLCGAKPLDDIIFITKDDISACKGHSRCLLERNAEPRRKYVFDLKQSYQTPHQIVASITKELKRIFASLPMGDDASFDDLAASLWAALALRCGATASEVMNRLDKVAPYSIPDFCTASERMPEPSVQEAIDELLIHELPKWYAMRLRRGISFNEIQREIFDRVRPLPELFYPVETIRKKLRGRTAVIEQPFISQTVFFKSHPENVLPMFAVIGDKAWCIKVTNKTGAGYAVIPQSDMLRFQRAIGVFSADADVQPLGTLAPKPGETVILIQPGYSDRKARVEEVLNGDCGTVLFKVKLTTDYGYEWRTTIDARQIEKIINAD